MSIRILKRNLNPANSVKSETNSLRDTRSKDLNFRELDRILIESALN